MLWTRQRASTGYFHMLPNNNAMPETALVFGRAAGVMVGRGCLGRPWLFRDIDAMYAGRLPGPPPTLGSVVEVALGHVRAWAQWESSEKASVLQMRKLIPLYLSGFQSASGLQSRLLAACSIADWEVAVAQLQLQGSFDSRELPDQQSLRLPRLKGSKAPTKVQKVSLPSGWLQDRSSEVFPDYLSEDACEG